MQIITPSVAIMSDLNGLDLLKQIEAAGRTCYKSEERINTDSAIEFAQNIIKRGHEAVLEHGSITVKFIVDRGVSHELVRHRIASFCQESTRYCNYSKGRFGGQITVVKPCFFNEDSKEYDAWFEACQNAEASYFKLLEMGCKPQEARSVLPNSLKTEVVMTANPREWRHFLKLRTSKAAHPQMREVVIPLLWKLQTEVPVLFEDITIQEPIVFKKYGERA